jgi:hypothetical protein
MTVSSDVSQLLGLLGQLLNKLPLGNRSAASASSRDSSFADLLRQLATDLDDMADAPVSQGAAPLWMAAMTPLRRVSGNQHLHCKSDEYRDAVRRKIAAYHRHIQLGLIAQGLLQILSAAKPKLVWQSFGSWIRTVRPGLAPSEQVVAIPLRNRLPEFLASAAKPSILVKFIRDRLDEHARRALPGSLSKVEEEAWQVAQGRKRKK